MSLLLVNLILAIFWIALTGTFTPPNLFFGFVLGYVVLYLVRKALGSTPYFNQIGNVVGFSFFFLWELVLANLRVALLVLSPRSRLKPRIVAVPMENCTDVEVTILANMISLTPGSLSLDVSSDGCTIFVHMLAVSDADTARAEIKNNLERRVLAILRGSTEKNGG